MNKFKWQNIYLWFMFAVLYLPIFYLIFYSFNAGNDMNRFTEFTLEHYTKVFEDSRLMIFIINTFILALLSALIATVIGTFGAIMIYYFKKNTTRQTFLNLNNILMVTPDVMIGASLLMLFTFLLPVKLGFFSVLIAHVAFNIPIVVLMVLPRLYDMNDTMITAAQDLGANARQIMGRVILPSISSGIFAGFFMAFTYSLDDFAVTFFVTGNGFSTLSVEIYSRARHGISLEINALSTLMFLLSFVLVIGYYIIQTTEQRRKKR
ncbi:ABC transporter permease subunit [Granulicatella sp. zg-ZJ]|uniref:ABC transporter permease n=1 Tax=Granulicatella sp. zg-ZJ TaxID=2678504 RepID=UPI0013D078A2|nr:ABC transporter permease [Granulicatella sp. zg-ZJ]MBS4751109.1 ABC transporter permease [Carnobacteriaceae bacterium zg-ZUI78]NEW62845.1 ABC transporter permease subunit [Granulicatella sp. zg-ZJ]